MPRVQARPNVPHIGAMGQIRQSHAVSTKHDGFIVAAALCGPPCWATPDKVRIH
ncbi:hypothetical protein PGTUg99_016739 [Puccinia graminis f. sp. tritici]|nr:hypothetical protein PGTUg99_016739 [Puccinia graminis f. sp. tritici]